MLRLPSHWVWDSWVADDGELFNAAPLVRRRDGRWAFLGFRNLEPDAESLEIVDSIPVGVRDRELRAIGTGSAGTR